MPGSPITVATYIIALAGAARAAQVVMSSGTDPMAIAKYEFEYNLSADLSITSETDVGLNIWRLSIKQKLTTKYETKYGLTIKCEIVPVVTLDAV